MPFLPPNQPDTPAPEPFEIQAARVAEVIVPNLRGYGLCHVAKIHSAGLRRS